MDGGAFCCLNNFFGALQSEWARGHLYHYFTVARAVCISYYKAVIPVRHESQIGKIGRGLNEIRHSAATQIATASILINHQDRLMGGGRTVKSWCWVSSLIVLYFLVLRGCKSAVGTSLEDPHVWWFAACNENYSMR